MILLSFLIKLYIIVVIIYTLMSWVPQLRASSFYYNLSKVVEPLLEQIRKVVPPVYGLDFSPVILIFILEIINHFLR